MEEKSIEELEKELEELRANNKAAWDTYGSELCAGDMIGKERALEERIAELKNGYPKDIQTLKLADDLFPSLKAGDKKLTIRKGRRDVKLGKLLFEGAKDESLKEVVEAVEVRYLRVSGVPDELCQEDGFDNWVDFYQGMKKYYPDLDVSEECTIIMFEYYGMDS